MADERSVGVYHMYQEASGKLDHLVVGITVALVGYLGVRSPVSGAGINAATAESLALLTLIGSTYCGLKRLENTTTLLGDMHSSLHHQEAGAAMIDAATKGMAVLDNSGHVLSPTTAMHRSANHRAVASIVEDQAKDASKRAARWYRWRNWLLIAGLLLLGAARLLALLHFANT